MLWSWREPGCWDGLQISLEDAWHGAHTSQPSMTKLLVKADGTARIHITLSDRWGFAAGLTRSWDAVGALGRGPAPRAGLILASSPYSCVSRWAVFAGCRAVEEAWLIPGVSWRGNKR
ncbi:hypothetical protein ACJQWK_10187 [Exserohilum turcicum]